MFVLEFVVLDVVTEDGARSFGDVGDVVVQVAAITLAAVLPVLAHVFSCLAARRSRRWKDLIPAALLVGLLAWWAVGLVAAGSGYWWIPVLAGGLGGAGILLSWTVRTAAHKDVSPQPVSH
jgi:anaerobic C4-dicarboxylate transporter